MVNYINHLGDDKVIKSSRAINTKIFSYLYPEVVRKIVGKDDKKILTQAITLKALQNRNSLWSKAPGPHLISSIYQYYHIIDSLNSTSFHRY